MCFVITILILYFLIKRVFIGSPILFDWKHILIYIGYSLFLIFLSFFIFSIFNWKLYKSLRIAQNGEKIREEEENEKLDSEIVKIVNDTVAKTPQLARKKKLDKLNKKYFWQ